MSRARSGLGFIVVLLTAGCVTSVISDPASHSLGSDPVRYAESERDWAAPVDFGDLRTQFGERDDFAQQCEIDQPIQLAAQAFAQGQWQEVLALATPFLDRCPVDMDFHFLRSVALSELGREAEAMQHQHWRHGLLESVMRSGDGKSPDTAWVVISVGEEYAVLRALGLERESQSLLAGGIDALSVRDEDGVASTVYFDPRASLARLLRRLER